MCTTKKNLYHASKTLARTFYPLFCCKDISLRRTRDDGRGTREVKTPIAMNLLNLEKTCEDNEFVKGLYSWQAAEGPASKCIQCGTCEAMCPQSIDIIDNLAVAVEHYES